MIAAAGGSSSTLSVEIPPGLQAGDELLVRHGEHEFIVVVPPGSSGGSLLDVELPASASASASAPRCVDVELPAGCQPGDEVIVTVDDSPLTVIVPDWVDGTATTMRVILSSLP